jgi:phage/plasmid-like protein (TIGR03299 family)
MAHEVESMFSVKETPWHGLGQVVQDAPTVEAAIKLAGLDWGVHLEPLCIKSDLRPVQANAVVRDTDKAILGHHVGPIFKPLQNAEAFAWFNPFVEAGECTFETAGSLRQGTRVWILAQLKRRPLEIVASDVVRKFLLLSHSHDGTLAIRVGFTPVRVVCANTLAMAHGDENSQLIRIRHTAGMHEALEKVREIINVADAAFEATAEQYRHLASRKVVNQADLKRFVIKVLDLTEEKKDGKPTGKLTGRSANILAAVLENVHGGKGNTLPGVAGTWWAAYNGLTEYLSYQRGRTADTRLNALWFGEGVALNAKALETALEMAV